jgi:hypothetical protein
VVRDSNLERWVGYIVFIGRIIRQNKEKGDRERVTKLVNGRLRASCEKGRWEREPWVKEFKMVRVKM